MERSKSGHKEENWEAIKIIRVRCDSGNRKDMIF